MRKFFIVLLAVLAVVGAGVLFLVLNEPMGYDAAQSPAPQRSDEQTAKPVPTESERGGEAAREPEAQAESPGGGSSDDAPRAPAAPSMAEEPSEQGLPAADRGIESRDTGEGANEREGSAPPASAPSPITEEANVPEEKQADEWDVVPVYYGTDRAEQPTPARLDYGSGRGRRLELGRALVTVPKAHVTPAIERPWAIRVPYLNITVYEEAEDPKTHFTIQEIKALKEEELLALVSARLAASNRYKDHALIFVHGYNTSFDYAIYRTAQISYDLKFDGAAFAYSWPSGGGLASYTYDRESSGQAEPYLKQFVELVAKKSGAKTVSIIAHSMGNQPMLQVLRDLKRESPDGVKISQIILAAPDVDRDNFENIASEIQGVASGITLYAAANDKALIVSRNFYGGVPRAGDVPATGPLVLPGLDTVDATGVSMDSLGLNHSGYAENNALLSDIGILIQTGERPPSTRTPILEQITTSKGAYWRYPPTAR